MIEPDFNSITWQWIKQWLLEQIAATRLQNDAPALDERTTAMLRGRIAAYKQLAEMPETMSRTRTRLEESRLIAGEE
jgi:hypothetical protein